MAHVISRNLWLCSDCTGIAANGTIGNEDADEDGAHAGRMAEHLGATQPRGVLVLDAGSIEFASRPCDGCGTTLAGFRHAACILR